VRAHLEPTFVGCGSFWCDLPEQFWIYQVRKLSEFTSWLNYLGFKTHFIIVVVMVVGVPRCEVSSRTFTPAARLRDTHPIVMRWRSSLLGWTRDQLSITRGARLSSCTPTE
jgi:hypothetical protein